MPATRRRYSPTIIVLFVFSLLPSSLGADDATNGTSVIQSQLNTAKQQQMAAQKQFTLKKAAVDVAKKRVAELQQQLKKFQQKVAEETKAFEAAEKNQTAKTKEVLQLRW